MRYYMPVKEDIVNGLEMEFFAEGQWHGHVVKEYAKWLSYLEVGNIRVKYVDSTDFSIVGCGLKKVVIGKQTVIIDILIDNTEITEEQTVYSEDVLIILKSGKKIGKFYPFLPEGNVEIGGKLHSIKNLSELRKILKL